ncbi:hypothetical protein VIBNISFn27_740042 [Vibrio nigripulchritudo SFn27]|nr:hypothetical protein VIBNIAM115_1060001 [Vibrio nigripulchritudo AM115]CCN64292.1 hypothetical protein VIBNIPon4_200049 [Vibrio nigripulchritudo POn4]CCN90573.1 hypothetical protein VIBNISFn27_740042 [Vibrio nigripulchritudo SFn27]CCO41847.1 hypothetical protein VIBNISFn135_620041 [Vibrio nigripulchritudo SFn135]
MEWLTVDPPIILGSTLGSAAWTCAMPKAVTNSAVSRLFFPFILLFPFYIDLLLRKSYLTF